LNQTGDYLIDKKEKYFHQKFVQLQLKLRNNKLKRRVSVKKKRKYRYRLKIVESIVWIFSK